MDDDLRTFPTDLDSQAWCGQSDCRHRVQDHPVVYHIQGKREYFDHGADYCEHKYRERALKKLKRQAAKLLAHPELSIFVHPVEAKPKRSRGAAD